MVSPAATRTPREHSAVWKARGTGAGLGGLSGLALFLWTHQYLTAFGTSTAVTAALAVSLGIACWLGLTAHSVLQRLSPWLAPAAWLTIAVWSASFVWLLGIGQAIVGQVPFSWLTSEATTFCIMLCVATGLLVPPVASCLILAGSLRGSHSTAGPLPSLTVLGAAIGLIAGPAVIAPVLGLSWLMVGLTAICAVGFWRSLTRAIEQVAPTSVPTERSVALCPWLVALSLVIGLQIPIASRFALQLMPGSPFEHFALWAGLIAGLGCGLAWAEFLARRHRTGVAADGPLVAAALAAIWPVVLLSVWGLLVDLLLTVNSRIATVPLVMLIRIAIAALATAPLGIALGRLWSVPGTGSRSRVGAVLCMTFGVVLVRSTAVPPVGLASLLVLVAMMTAVARYWILGLPALGSYRLRISSLATVLSVALLPVVSGNYRPDRSAELLFSTNTFSALQMGISRDLLPHLDDGRLVAMEEGRQSTWTIWKYRGTQLALRQDGLPRGVLSTDPQTSPQFAGEVMPAVLPMVLHQRPQSVRMLGLGSTASLSCVLSCPVEEVTCIEGDTDLVRLVNDVLVPASGFNPLGDGRVRLFNADPTMAMLARQPPCDVLIINESQPSVIGSVSGFTSEFYSAARKSLNDGGLLCQRLQYADFGRGPIEDLLATVRSAFPQVALFDAAPGEMLIVATDRPGPLVTGKTIDRCQRPHIRNLMAHVGWDWSVLMNVGAIGPEAVQELTAEQGTPNTIRNGRFAYGLPQEVMRWSSPQFPKWQERQQLLSTHANRMLDWIDEPEQSKEVQQRLADVVEQQRLIAEHPDRFWAYRQTLKERLTDRPRAVIQQVDHEGLRRTLHPEDRRRKEYLEVLGTAATADDPVPADIRRLAGFAAPYDPLVSYFLHQEAARLYELSSADDPAARYRHLRYSIFFGPPGDQAVRNVITALAILGEHPEVVADPADRFDEMNALLEVLKQRSIVRLQSDASASAFELVDAERSIAIAKRTMAMMDDMQGQAGIPADDWTRRKTVLERLLVRPMWKYHSQQAAKLAKHKAQIQALAQPDPDDDFELR